MDLVIPAGDTAALREITSWDGFRPATFPPSEYPVDVVRLDGSSSPPLLVSRSRRSETLKALPASLRQRAGAAFEAFGKRPASWLLARGRELDLSDSPLVMGVVNVTPDSFSDGGQNFDRETAVDRVLELFEAGAAIVDVGGESTRPATYEGAAPVGEEEELSRVLPVIEGARKRTDAPLSIDTRRAGVARRALEAGADAVNDVSGFRFDPAMAETVARAGAGAILMHMKGLDPRTMQDDVAYGHPLADVARELAQAAEDAAARGVRPGAIAVDPGLGFGKSAEGNLVLLRYLSAFRSLGRPIAVGASRKGFVRRFSGVSEDASAVDRLPGSLACAGAAAEGGAAIVRVHDVLETVRYFRMRRAIVRSPAPGSAVSVGETAAAMPAGSGRA